MLKHPRNTLLNPLRLPLNPLRRPGNPPLHDPTMLTMQSLLALLVVADLVNRALLVLGAAIGDVVVGAVAGARA